MSEDTRYIVGIDPGNTRSAWAVIGEQTMRLYGFGHEDNGTVLANLRSFGLGRLLGNPHMAQLTFVLEKVENYGKNVGDTIFDTVFWTGRFYEAIAHDAPEAHVCRIGRKTVKMHLCRSNRANDSHVRRALIDKYGPGKGRAVGTKKAKGPLYGVANDVWAALAVAVAYAENL